MTIIAVKLAIRFVVFGVVLVVAMRQRQDIHVRPRWAMPVVALAIALFNAALYPLLAPIVHVASMGFGFLVAPLALNGLLLYVLGKQFRFFTVDGVRALVWLTLAVTAAHAALYIGFRLAF